MDDATRNMVAESICTQCGTRADVGFIFCTKCGSALRPPAPLVSSLGQDVNSRPNPATAAKGILLVFALFAVFDFGWGYVHQRSIPAGVISVIGGLFGTAFYLLVMWPWKNKRINP